MQAALDDAVLDTFRARIAARRPLRLRGGGSKDFYGGVPQGDVLDTRAYAGVINYEPSELVITARAGTPLAELEALLLAQGQCLPFEPPHFASCNDGADGAGAVTTSAATLGGAVAAGLSGPRRYAVGALRDFVLGVTLMDGEGRVLKFGGEVMKNVAGFDVSRLMAGSLGTLGLLLDVSLKVLPVPVAEASIVLALNEADALAAVNAWAGQPLPIAATCWTANNGGQLHLRLAGAQAAVDVARKTLGGEAANYSRGDTAPGADFWADLRNHRHAFFAGDAPLWRVAVPTTTPPLNLGDTLIEWGGGQRWLRGEHDAAALRATMSKLGGHATLFRGGDKSAGVFSPLAPALAAIHRRLKQSFDPHGVFNPGRLYPDVS